MEKLAAKKLNLSFGNKQILKNVNIAFAEKEITSLIGPSGCGKSTLLRSFNRMHDLSPDAKIDGLLSIDNTSLYDPKTPVTEIRKRIGMVFQKPNPLPKSIYENMAYGLRIHNYDKSEIPDRIEQALKDSYIWEEVKDDLKKPAVRLSGGQQQRLCIARTVVLRPEVILMDEPCSALDPISTRKIEDLTLKLKEDFTIVIVTHSMSQAQRVSDKVAFMYLGELIEFGTVNDIFKEPKNQLTQNYIGGRFG